MENVNQVIAGILSQNDISIAGGRRSRSRSHSRRSTHRQLRSVLPSVKRQGEKRPIMGIIPNIFGGSESSVVAEVEGGRKHRRSHRRMRGGSDSAAPAAVDATAPIAGGSAAAVAPIDGGSAAPAADAPIAGGSAPAEAAVEGGRKRSHHRRSHRRMRGGDADAPIAGGACGAVAGGRKMMWGGAIAGGSVAGGSVAADSAPADVEGGKRSKRSLGTKMKAHLAMTRERAMRIKAEHPSWPGNRVWREAMIMGRRSRSRR